MLESTAKNPKLVSPTTHESPSTLSLPVLPEELISDILLRLPVRSLIQFSCVSKSWKTLISNPQFAKDHLRNSAQQRLMTSFCASKAVSFSLHSLFQNPPNPLEGQRLTMKGSYNILGSCNGLLCLSDVHDGNVLLWNPSTRTASKRFALDVGTVRDNNYYGFGYDHLIDKYKLVVVARTIQETVTKIYTFGADSWTVIPTSPRYPIYWLGKFVGGTLNWLAKGGASDDQWVILSLDFGTEMFSEMLLPVGDGDNVCSPLLKVLDDRVYVCFFDSKNTHVWLMKEYGVQESWTKLMIIPHLIEGSSSLLYVIHLCFDLLCVLEDGVVLFKTTLGKLVRYNSNDGRFDYPRIRAKLRGHLLIYHESLVSPEC